MYTYDAYQFTWVIKHDKAGSNYINSFRIIMSRKPDNITEKPSGEELESHLNGEDPSMPSQKLEIRDMPNEEIHQAAEAGKGSHEGPSSSPFEAHDINQIPSQK